jgi:dTDP-4-amino-4,6-dideoxygalactose transaminase
MLLRESERYGLGLAPAYPDAINGITELRNDFDEEQFPMAQKLSRRLVTLPVHPLVSKRDRSRIASLFDLRGMDDTTVSAHHTGRVR